jgi:hypothetical protein
MKAILAAFARANAGAAQPANPGLRHPQARGQSPHHDDPRRPQRHAPAHHSAQGRSGFDCIPTLIPPMTSSMSPNSIAIGTCEPSNAGPNLRPSQPNLGQPQRKITVRLPLVCLKATAVTTSSRRERPSARSSRLELDGLTRTAMKFTVTCRVGVTEVVDRPESARAALEHVLIQLGRKRNDVRIFDEDGRPRTPADLCRLAAREVAMAPDHQD